MMIRDSGLLFGQPCI